MWKILLFSAGLLICLHPAVHASHALVIGLVISVGLRPFGGLPGPSSVYAGWSKKLLALAVVGLGFGIQAHAAVALGRDYATLVIGSILLTLLAAWWLTRWLGVEQKTGYLIGAGTAICGGSAIAAVAPAIQARAEQIAVALGCVFILNGVALLVFPWVGQLLAMDPEVFGVWAAVAIHDTSSVVGAAQAYHPDALTSATTLKLARAVFIVPLVLLSVWLFAKQSPRAGSTLRALPSFMPWFIAVVIVVQIWPHYQNLYQLIQSIAQTLLVVSIYLLGCSLNIDTLRRAGAQPMLLAVSLWILIAGGALAWLVL